jgi:3-mercaptopyruvate sulfurtransferase SseA
MKSSARCVFLSFVGVWVLIVALLSVSASAAELKKIKPEELKQMIESKKTDFLVVDAQPQGVYKTGHVKGAINLPWAPELKSPKNLPKNKLLIIYCDCAHEEDATDTATQLVEKFGYTDVGLLEGGWSKWQELGYPIENK